MSKLIVSAHQPNFLPYLGFFDKMKKSDIMVIRDEVLFIKKEFHNRNRIRINGHDNLRNPQWKWLSVPVIEKKDYIKHIPVKKDAFIKKIPWNKKIIHEIKANYQGAEYLESFFPKIYGIFEEIDEKLVSLNMKIINFFKEAFEIDTEIIMASELGLRPDSHKETMDSDASEDLVNICKELGADVYLSGAGGKSYISQKPFEREGIELVFHDFQHPVYKQKFPGFVPNMSAMDSLFCAGKSVLDIQIQEQILNPVLEIKV